MLEHGMSDRASQHQRKAIENVKLNLNQNNYEHRIKSRLYRSDEIRL